MLRGRECDVGEERVVVNRLAQEAEAGSREALVGMGLMLWATVSHRRLLSMAATRAGRGSTVLMEPDKAQRTVTEMIKGLARGLGREAEE